MYGRTIKKTGKAERLFDLIFFPFRRIAFYEIHVVPEIFGQMAQHQGSNRNPEEFLCHEKDKTEGSYCLDSFFLYRVKDNEHGRVPAGKNGRPCDGKGSIHEKWA